MQKNGLKFSFELAAPTGNPRRNYAANIIQQNLREIGIDCRLRFDESLMFNKNQNHYRYYAELEGFNKGIQNVRLSLLATLGNMYEWKVKSVDN